MFKRSVSLVTLLSLLVICAVAASTLTLVLTGDLRREEVAAAGANPLTKYARLDEILQIVDRCYVISDGKVLCDGTPEQIKQHEEVRRRYLGDIDGPLTGPPAPHMLVAWATERR